MYHWSESDDSYAPVIFGQINSESQTPLSDCVPALDVHLALKKRSSLHSNIIDVLIGILPSSSAVPSTTKSTSGAIQPGLTKNDKQNRYYIKNYVGAIGILCSPFNFPIMAKSIIIS